MLLILNLNEILSNIHRRSFTVRNILFFSEANIINFFSEGTFMIYVRFRTKSNATYIEIETTLEIRAIGIKDYISDYIRPL